MPDRNTPKTDATVAEPSQLNAYVQLLSSLFDRLPVALYILAKRSDVWRVDFVSQGLSKILGFDPTDWQGKPYHTLWADDSAKVISGGDSENQPETCLRLLKTRYQGPKIFLDRSLICPGAEADHKAGVLMEPGLDLGLDFLDYQPAALERRAFGRPPVSKKAPTLISPPPAPGQLASPRNYEGLGDLLGRSPQIKKVFDRVLKIAPTKGRVLIEGESGTGKELAARVLHDLSSFRDGPFIAINCGAISDSLIESEFFGHVRGAFSGATENRRGYLDVVDGGTLFLDEIGEMPQKMQVKLLRVLDGYGHTAVGSTESKTSRFRLICATNRNLEEEVKSGGMRYDFYHRLKQLTIYLPPLRERQGDIEYLIQVFAERYLNEHQAIKIWSRPVFPPQAKAKFMAYHWPGNVRELHHQVLKYLSLHEIDFAPSISAPKPQDEIQEPFAAMDAAVSTPPSVENGQTFYDYDRRNLISALESCAWNTQQAANILGKSLRTVQRKIAKYKLRQ